MSRKLGDKEEVMDINGAYQKVAETINEIRGVGIKVVVVSSRSRNNPEIVAKYRGVDRLPPDLWFHVTFYPASEDQARLVSTAAKELYASGISFDTGGCKGERDWEIDWSFRCGQFQDPERGRALDHLDNLLADMDNEKLVH